MPASVAPALVSKEVAALVHARLAWNRKHMASLIETSSGTGFHALLTGGFAVCGGCGGTISLHHMPGRETSGPRRLRHRYVCRTLRAKGACVPRTMECHLLDAAVWRRIVAFLRDRDWIASEVERLHETSDPGAAAEALIDGQLADVEQRIRSKRQVAENVQDEREGRELAGEIDKLALRRTALEHERTAASAHYASWKAQQEGLERTLDWAERVGQHADTATYEQKRMVIAALHVRVTLNRANETPRVRLYVELPLAGVLELPMAAGDEARYSTEQSVTAPYKYPREIEFVAELPKTISGKIRRVDLHEREQRRKQGVGGQPA